MKYNKKENFDTYSEKGQEANQMEQISPGEAKKQPLPTGGFEDEAISEKKFIIKPKPEKNNNDQKGPNKQFQIISYGLINICWILLLSLAAFYLCEN
jgi:hypothetical protein